MHTHPSGHRSCAAHRRDSWMAAYNVPEGQLMRIHQPRSLLFLSSAVILPTLALLLAALPTPPQARSQPGGPATPPADNMPPPPAMNPNLAGSGAYAPGAGGYGGMQGAGA